MTAKPAKAATFTPAGSPPRSLPLGRRGRRAAGRPSGLPVSGGRARPDGLGLLVLITCLLGFDTARFAGAGVPPADLPEARQASRRTTTVPACCTQADRRACQPPAGAIGLPVSAIQTVAPPMATSSSPLASPVPETVRRTPPIRQVSDRGRSSRLVCQSRRSHHSASRNRGATIPNT